MQKVCKAKKAAASFAAVAVALVMGVGVLSGTSLVSASEGTGLTKYYTDFNSMEEAKAAAEELNREIVGEGASLLKNSNEALPLSGGEWVSVFGVRSDNLIGASDSSGAWSSATSGSDETVAAALEHAGFHVNPTLVDFYALDQSEIGAEVTDFTGQVDSSTKIYNDVAFIVLSREGGEGSDASRVTDQTVGAEDDHKALYDWAFANYSFVEVIPAGLSREVPVISGTELTAGASTEGSAYALLKNGESYTTRLELPGFVFAPISAGESAGRAVACMGGREIASVRMVYSEKIPVQEDLLFSPGERFLRFWLMSGCSSPFYLEEGRVAI